MKRTSLVLLISLSAAIVSACGGVEPDKPVPVDPTPSDPVPVDPTPQEPQEPEEDGNTIAGTLILEGNDLAGRITSTADGNGIAGVTVTDGYTCVQTDANGVYQFKSNARTRLVYYSTPADYRIETEPDHPSIPLFYKAITPESGKVVRTDFALTPLAEKETTWTFIGIGDPQCSKTAEVKRYTDETMADIRTTLAGTSHVYAMTLGDIIYDSCDMWPSMRDAMSDVGAAPGWHIPFFQTIGNHDHDARVSDTSDDDADDYAATATYIQQFGPTDYSFNRGDVHIVVMDNILVQTQKTSSKSNGRTWSHDSGFTDTQFEWLKQDLAAVPDQGSKMVIFCAHKPFCNADEQHFYDVLSLLQQFKEAHLMIGHTHLTRNYIYSSSKANRPCAGGLALYEHVHGAACGAWWACNSTTTGEPNGYTIYTVEGAHMRDWQFKGTGKDIGYQLRIFDGNEVYYDAGKYPLNWYTPSQPVGSLGFSIIGNKNNKGCFVAQTFNEDNTFWTLEMYDKATGTKLGDFTRITNGSCANAAMSSYYYNVLGKTTDSFGKKTVSHYWYFKPASGNPSDLTGWEARLTHRLPGGDVTHTYTCSTLTRQQDFPDTF